MKYFIFIILVFFGGLKVQATNNDTQPNINIVAEYFSALKTGDFGALEKLFDVNIVWHQPGNGVLSNTYRGQAEVFKLFSRFMEISQGSFKIDEVYTIMENNSLVTATLKFSASKPGESIAMDGVDLMRIKDGKIVEVWLFSADQKAEDNFWK